MPREIPTIGLAELAAIRGGAALAGGPTDGVANPHGALKELTSKPARDGSFTRLLPFFGSHER